jgi:hypothetical protein
MIYSIYLIESNVFSAWCSCEIALLALTHSFLHSTGKNSPHTRSNIVFNWKLNYSIIYAFCMTLTWIYTKPKLVTQDNDSPVWFVLGQRDYIDLESASVLHNSPQTSRIRLHINYLMSGISIRNNCLYTNILKA